jgi:hypothetical protein
MAREEAESRRQDESMERWGRVMVDTILRAAATEPKDVPQHRLYLAMSDQGMTAYYPAAAEYLAAQA